MTACWRCRVSATPATLGDAVPRPAGGPQLGDGEELVGRGGEAELQLAGRGIDVEPAPVSDRRWCTPRASASRQLIDLTATGLVDSRAASTTTVMTWGC